MCPTCVLETTRFFLLRMSVFPSFSYIGMGRFRILGGGGGQGLEYWGIGGGAKGGPRGGKFPAGT